jgi:long-chain acyl-CoA synthetase
MIEGYGLTESSGGICSTRPCDPVTGHVGGPLKCCKFRLRDIPEMNYFSTDKPYPRGELMLKGPSIFTGYYKRPDTTA